ncbi:hypothetical protein SCLCIDRAFT_24196 [Scleroderma citrinum Foug A]|uniref:Uncharacterized protein n=1 Tax=Scleroderma citrinum Foug A TaxID=1036808 RepID=A0A0C3AEZ9_9AGAM|nr:hypothetical protein SCLCIDRAFT_24196 [Scleroderma citrinum Foug A]
MTSSSFTFLSGTTDNSSVSSTLFDGTRPPREDPSNNASTVQLKKLYHSISTLESKILNKDSDDNADEGHVLLKGHGHDVSEDELEQQKCKESYPTISDFIYFAYTFYTNVLEEPTLCTFHSGWFEALGNLARYHMAIAAMVANSQFSGARLTTDAVFKAAATSKEPLLNLPSLNVGIAAEAEGKELRAVYHCEKYDHPVPILDIPRIYSSNLDLFVLLHGILFTNIQLDDFTPTLTCFPERLKVEVAEECE